MPASDFRDAHDRHWDDAEFLLDDDRIANADQAYGLSAECGLKAVMRAQGGLPMSGSMPRESDHRRHIDRFWQVYVAYASGRTSPRLPEANPFHDWSVHQRYMHRDVVDHGKVHAHRHGAHLIRTLVRRARWDGSTR